MSDGHIQRLLLAEKDRDAAQGFVEIATAALKLHAEALQTETNTVIDRSTPAYAAWVRAKRELKELNRICLRHAARRADVSNRAQGLESDMESQAIWYDITHPIREHASSSGSVDG